MKRVCLIAVLAASFGGCTTNRSEPVGFARHPQLKSDRSARRSRGSTEASETPRILPETYYAAGRVAEQQGSPERAIEHYQKAIMVNHQYTAAFARLGLMYSITGQHEKAVEAFERAVETKPRSAILRNNLGFELLYVERWDEAERHLRQAAELDPNLAHAQINLGILLGRKGRYDQALASFQNVLSEADAHYNLGLLYRAQGQHADAAESFRYVLSLHPDFSAAKKQLTLVERMASTQTTRSTVRPEGVTKTAPAIETGIPGVLGNASAAPIDHPTKMVDLGLLIEQIIPAQPVQPELPTVIGTPVAPVTRTPQATTPITMQDPISRESVSVTVNPTIEMIPVESATIEAPQPRVVMPTPEKATATFEPILEPAKELQVPTAKVEKTEIKPEPVAEPTVRMIPVLEPIVEERPAIRQEMPLAEMARIQQNAHNVQVRAEPTVTVDSLPTPSSTKDEEVTLVLGESESMHQTADDVAIVEPVLSQNTQDALVAMDSMEKSLDILRNEIECQRESGVAEKAVEATKILPVQPPVSNTMGEIIPITTFGSNAPAEQPATAGSKDPSVAYIQALPVTSEGQNENAHAAPESPDPGPAYYTPPKTTPRRVRPGQRR